MCNNIIGEITGVTEKTQGSQKYLIGTIKSDKIKNVTFVPVLELSRSTYLVEDNEEGYQRPGSQSRMRAFAKFLKDNPSSIVPPVLLSGRGAWIFEPDAPGQSSGRLLIQDKAAVIDGQHRLGGFVFLYESSAEVRDILFILLPDFNIEAEKQEFLIVNNTQKGVPKAQISYLEDSEEAQIGWALNEESDSPFKDKISRTELQPTQLFKLNSVEKQVRRLFAVSNVQDLDIDQKIEIMSRFWIIIADQLPEAWSEIEKVDRERLNNRETRGRRDFEYKLLELTGLIAWSHAGAQILSRSYSEDTGMNWDNVRNLVEHASGIDWYKDGEFAGRTGEAGGKLMADEMIRMLPSEGTL